MKDFIQIPKNNFEIMKNIIIHPDCGWANEMNRCYINGTFALTIRDIETEYGKCHHMSMMNINKTEIKWREKYQIKNKIFGEDFIAVEVFPKKSDLIDVANIYHLWIYPKEYDLPFNLNKL